jgi:DEAD/DEAH box helicase domain-containing protein
MIPSVLSQHVEQGVKDFLRTTFPVSTPFFSNILERLLEEPGSLFKGPYLDIQLPFQQGKAGADYFSNLPMAFPPYQHQENAFNRLTGPNPKSTIVATGTGSGKTECFLYPILDYCYQHRGEPGIKAVIIYPMNALATDQAGRLAKLIYNSQMRGHISAGIYVGQREKEPSMLMKPDKLISDKNTLRLSPPDILLTNYKMLDYLLIRPEDRPLWQHNNIDSLKFLVVDELHTFDGAQGSDLGCLIRRLKARLAIEPNYLCCVGTSATLGSNEEQVDLLEYTSTVFGEDFTNNAIITESRLTAGEFLGESLISQVDIVSQEKSVELNPVNYDRYEDYIRTQYFLWIGEDIQGDFNDPEWRVELGKRITEHLFFQNLLKVLGGKIFKYESILYKLEKATKGLKNDDQEYKINLLNSLLALVSEARTKTITIKVDGTEEEIIRPFLNVRIQLWLRELRRMVGKVSNKPLLRFADDLNEEQLNTHLPLVHCRECGSMGWSGLKRKNSSDINGELQSFYNAFFGHDPKVVYLFPEDEKAKSRSQNAELSYFCPQCLNLTQLDNPDRCPLCDHNEMILVYVPNNRKKRGDRQVSTNDCPYCGKQNSLTLLGSRAASLTSVMIVQLYSSSFNNDKKLLTFSDNVQDAAHRAGFFNGRTFRFNFRTALQKAILALGDGLPLAEIPSLFIKHWSGLIDENKYISTFLAPNMDWLYDYEVLKNSGVLPEGSTLKRDIDRRIGWEIISEYGFQSRIGRTLEKTGSSVAYVDQELLNGLVAKLIEPIRNEIGGFRELDELSLTRFLLGLIVHLKNQGGILQPVLESYINDFGNSYLINRTIWMPGFGQNSRTPVFLTTRRGTRFDQLFGFSLKQKTWYENWAEKSFEDLHFVTQVVRDLYLLVLKGLTDMKLFSERQAKEDLIWGIRPDILRVTSSVIHFQCVQCGHSISVADEESSFFEGAYCQRFYCFGKYKQQETSIDYYGKLYASGDVERIFAQEHTGLLKRQEREQLELDFKAEDATRQPWFPNLLSCTPTLEMGIDIGDLSSLVLCSVPPAQANYLQRIGRAGRRDGNALNLTVANARPHDLFFFAEPEEMLAGHLETPGIFLDASAVLERQFTAFCFDRWIMIDIKASLPQKLGQVLSNLEPEDKSKFPHSLIHFLETNQVDLFDMFVALFDHNVKLSADSINNLRIFVDGDKEQKGSLRYKIMNGLHNRNLERDSLKKKVRILNGKINKIKKGPKDKNFETDLRDLGIEKSALQALVRSISDRNTFNFFTDEGLLPNYAFPEVGVMLKSLIYRKKMKAQEGESSYDTWNYEFERPAVSALQELAPANTFYAGGRKVTVDQVDMTVSDIENWRFCNNCSHKEIIGEQESRESCIKCGNLMWSDDGQKRSMLKMRQVFASTPDRKSRISDDSDDRNPVFYNRQMLVEFQEKQVMEAFKVDADFPFGFDFHSKVDFCEINFGEKNEGGQKSTIAGSESCRKGFSLCTVCGKVQEGNVTPTHALTCTARDKDSDKHLKDCVYLYRQFTSEAIRILLPVSIIAGSNKKLQSFVAALQLGLKRKFKGKVDHLQTTIHEEPLRDSSFRKKYLVLYDTIPGGTGYLKQLMRSEDQLMEVLELSLDTLKTCACHQEEDKDGCYRCIFAYRSSYNMSETSRTTAIELFGEILSYKDKLVKTENLKSVSLNTFIESELEARFLGALKHYRTSQLHVLLTNELINGKPGYFLKIGEKAYYIEPQVNLGELDGVSIPSRADFVIRSARSKDSIKPIAVFLDGYAYHRDRVGEDMAQRMAIIQSGKFHIWSLSWYDVENKFKPQKTFYVDFMDTSMLPAGKSFNDMLNGYKLSDLKGLHKKNSFDLLIQYLQNPEDTKWISYMFAFTLLHVDPAKFSDPETIRTWEIAFKNVLPENFTDKLEDIQEPRLYGLLESKDSENAIQLNQHTIIEQSALTPPGNQFGVLVGCCLNDEENNRLTDEFQLVWNGYLRLFNFFQFLPYTFFTTREGIFKKAYDRIAPFEEKVTVDTTTNTEAWEEIKELTEHSIHELLDWFENSGWSVPEVGYELEGQEGEVIATAELAWIELKIVFLLEEEQAFESKFNEAGWSANLLTEVLDNPEKYLSLNKNKEE